MQHLSRLPLGPELSKLMKSLAMLDAIIEPEWEYRYYSYNCRWGDGEEMGSIRNGSGDDLFAVFSSHGCFLRGFDHEAEISPWAGRGSVWPGVLEGVPIEFLSQLNEPAFHMQDTTFCIWMRAGEKNWSNGPVELPASKDPDGSEWMLALLDGKPESYRRFVNEYYECEVSLEAIMRVFAHEPLSDKLLAVFPKSRGLKDLLDDASEIGYGVEA